MLSWSPLPKDFASEDQNESSLFLYLDEISRSPKSLVFIFSVIMMLGSKGFLTPLIPDCYVLCTPAIFKNIRNPLIFLRKMATYSCFWRVKRSKILLQASLHRLFDLLTLVSYNISNNIHVLIRKEAANHEDSQIIYG